METKENRVFEERLRAARERLENRDFHELAAKAGIEYDGSCFKVDTLGQKITVRCPDMEVEPKIEEWRHILLLHYMDTADGVPLTGELVAFTQLKDGTVRGGDFNNRCDKLVREVLGKLPEAQLREKCLSLGAQLIDTNADLTAVFPFFPRYPMTLKLWLADDEFDASGKFFLDSSCGHYMNIEAAVTAGEIILSMLTP